MKNQVIEVLNKEHGKQVIEYWKSRGVDTLGLTGVSNKEENDKYRFYGVINEIFYVYPIKEVEANDAEIITLPESRTFPRKMLVSRDGESWVEREVFACINGLYFVFYDTVNKLAKGCKFAKEIDEPKTVTLTVDDLMGKVDKLKEVFGVGEKDTLVITL